MSTLTIPVGTTEKNEDIARRWSKYAEVAKDVVGHLDAAQRFADRSKGVRYVPKKKGKKKKDKE